ncbi:hypothetical protein C8R45DRAFT_1100850 [Mycena sanguinolenta]|nr:hypothetical protein C8R45DRAFT_1100850 [Mycena sanguinolenta]
MAYGDTVDYPYQMQFPSWLSPLDAPHSQDPPLAPRITLAGNLDPTTGIFYRTPEHPRLRTAQACEKCRARKAKCSGDHPSCLSPTSLPYPTSVNMDTRRRRRNTTVPTISSVKLEPLSSCMPLALPSRSKAHHHMDGREQLSIDTNLHRPLNVHRSSAEKCMSLPTSLSSPHQFSGLATISSTYTPYPNSDSYASEYTDSAYTYSKREGFDGLLAAERPRALKYEHDRAQGYVSHEAHGLDRSDHRAVFPCTADAPGPSPFLQYSLGQRSCEQEGQGLVNLGSGSAHLAHSVRLRPVSSMGSNLAMRRASTRSLSGSVSGGSPESVNGGTAPASSVSGSFPLFKARWSPSPHAYSSSLDAHVYPPTISSHPRPYFADDPTAPPMNPSYGMRPHSTYLHSPPGIMPGCDEQDHIRHQYDPMQPQGPYDAQGRFQMS